MSVPFARAAESIFTSPLGFALTSWSYVWRTTPIYRREWPGSPDYDLPPSTPSGVPSDRVLHSEHGAGPLFHRTYTGRICGARCSAESLMERLRSDPNVVAPLALARFRKTAGTPWRMQAGDEFLVRMPGPWDGPVRVVELTSTSFRFVTLEGHLEAGQIEWRARQDDGLIDFEVESWAREGDRLSVLLHDRLRMAKEVQLHMWTSVVERVAKRTQGRLERGIEIETRRSRRSCSTTGGRLLQLSALHRLADPPDDLGTKAPGGGERGGGRVRTRRLSCTPPPG